eukprot:comp23898_c0_seq1/m.42021 comp23898_c0_seq1/g.42021  ORF comp23898_c0_seq1/g.42021 comp23898_c0_seq1/m.42021 type:complete len:491 (-) comp23898_c0_seq1:926-2398(-)
MATNSPTAPQEHGERLSDGTQRASASAPTIQNPHTSNLGSSLTPHDTHEHENGNELEVKDKPLDKSNSFSKALNRLGSGLLSVGGVIKSPRTCHKCGDKDERNSGSEYEEPTSSGPVQGASDQSTESELSNKPSTGLAGVRLALLHKLGIGRAKATPSGQVEDLPAVPPEQLMFEAFSVWLQEQKLKGLKELPVTLEVPEGFKLPAWGNPEGDEVKSVTVLKRFNSRKQPHLLDIVNVKGEHTKYIYKQEDDISMDACVLKLLVLANKIWEKRGYRTHIRTYNVVACSDLTGFCEVVPGETMLHQHAKEMDEILGMDINKWRSFLWSVIAVIVTTCAFDITDRHHNNVMLTPDGDVVLIDLSASLGNKAPMDKGMGINPIYMPGRFKKIAHVIREKKPEDLNAAIERWSDLEEHCMLAYYALYNDRTLEAVLKEVNYTMPKPGEFLRLLKQRKHVPQIKEGLRNDIVETMDSNVAVNKMVAAICSIIPMN